MLIRFSLAEEAAANVEADVPCDSFVCTACKSGLCGPLLGAIALIFGTLVLSKLYVDYSAGVTPLKSSEAAKSPAADRSAAAADDSARGRRSRSRGPAEGAASPAVQRSVSRPRSRGASVGRSAGSTLSALPGVGPTTAKKLEEAGIDSLAALQRADADALAAMLKDKADGGRSPGPKLVKKWIEAAKEL